MNDREIVSLAREDSEARIAWEWAHLRLHAAMRAAHELGVSAYRLSQLTGISERHVGRIVKG